MVTANNFSNGSFTLGTRAKWKRNWDGVDIDDV